MDTRTISRIALGATLCATVAFMTGCTAHAGARTAVYTEADVVADGPRFVFVKPPTLVEVGPDIWIVENYDHEIYYSGGWYWVRYGDGWYRSASYANGWARVDIYLVPTTVVRTRPGTYVAYHRHSGAVVRTAPASRASWVPPGHRNPPGERRGQAAGHEPPGHHKASKTRGGPPENAMPAEHKKPKHKGHH